jgi:hypothetical protein
MFNLSPFNAKSILAMMLAKIPTFEKKFIVFDEKVF